MRIPVRCDCASGRTPEQLLLPVAFVVMVFVQKKIKPSERSNQRGLINVA